MAVIEDDELDVLGKIGQDTPPEQFKYVIPPDAPVLPSIVSGNRDAELMVDQSGNAMVIYNQPLPEDVEWIEYDIDLDMLTFVTYSGKVQGLGMKVHKPFRKYLSKAKEIMLVYLENSQDIRGFLPVKLIVRYTGIN